MAVLRRDSGGEGSWHRVVALGSGSSPFLAGRRATIGRTISLRAAILLQIAAATGLGTEALASNQITMTVWNFASYGLDALATSAQILVGQGLGSKDRERVKAVLGRCLNRGLVYGAVLGIALAALSGVPPTLMSPDPAVRNLATHSLWIAAVAFPIASVACRQHVDGVLIGAGDTAKLAT